MRLGALAFKKNTKCCVNDDAEYTWTYCASLAHFAQEGFAGT